MSIKKFLKKKMYKHAKYETVAAPHLKPDLFRTEEKSGVDLLRDMPDVGGNSSVLGLQRSQPHK